MPLCGIKGCFVVSFQYEWLVCGKTRIDTLQLNGFEHGYSSSPRGYYGQRCRFSFVSNSGFKHVNKSLGFTRHDWSYRNDSHSKAKVSRSSIAICFAELTRKCTGLGRQRMTWRK